MKVLSIVSRRGLGRLAATGLGLGALIVAAAAVPQKAEAQQVGGTLKLAFDHEAGSFDPAKARDPQGHAPERPRPRHPASGVSGYFSS